MSLFEQHSVETAPKESKAYLEGAQNALGFIPNLYKYLAESPAALDGYMTLSKILEKSSLSPQQQQMVLLAISRENECEFCVAAHSMIGSVMVKLDTSVIQAIREGRSTGDEQSDALIGFATLMVQKRGWVDEAELNKFFDAGFSQKQALDVVLAVSLKTLSNYTNHMTGTTTNKEMSEFAWSRSSK